MVKRGAEGDHRHSLATAGVAGSAVRWGSHAADRWYTRAARRELPRNGTTEAPYVNYMTQAERPCFKRCGIRGACVGARNGEVLLIVSSELER